MSKKKSSKTQGLPPQRRKEILGFLLIFVGVLLALAVVTYTPADDSLARSFSFGRAIDPGENRASNALGLFGAWLAYGLVANSIGYFSLVVSGLLCSWGYLLFRNRTPVYLPLVSVLSAVTAILAATFFGWLALAADSNLTAWSGSWGIGVANWMRSVFGAVGSLIILIALLCTAGLLLVDHDIQRTIDRLEEGIASLRRRFANWRTEAKAVRAERRAALKAEKEARQAETPSTQKPNRKAAAKPAVLEEEHALPKQPSLDEEKLAEAAARRERERLKRRRAAEAEIATERTAAPVRPVARAEISVDPPSSEKTEDDGVMLHVAERLHEERTDRLDRPSSAPVLEHLSYEMPNLELLDEEDDSGHSIDYDELEENKQVLLDKLATYNIEITDINAIVGPTVTLYELTPAPGVKISKITALEDDLAMAMAARGIRMIAPIPGKSAIGVEIPNRNRELVRIKDILGTAKFANAQMELPLAIGKTIEGEVFIRDLTKMPHLLIAGSTGSGKSVGLNACISGLLFACHPGNLKFVMIDPKKIELQPYSRILDHYIAMPEGAEDPIITDVSQALGTLRSCEREMEERYDLLSAAQVRSVAEYNRRFASGRISEADGHRHLPYIVVIVDELADLMMTAGKEIEGPIARLAQMARAVGIHLILATQRPSVDVITGLIKANFPARIAYQVASKIDSRTILDQNGAQGLVGNGDLLYMLGSYIIRLQGPFVSEDEVDRIASYVATQKGVGPYRLPLVEDPADSQSGGGNYAASERDDLFDDAARIIVRSQQGSVSLLQRKLSVGYSRAARIVDQLEDAGIVGPFEGSKARNVLVMDEIELDMLLSGESQSS
ncbi:MAG: DNA translocase FtsK [Rhodothermales bacterium]